MAIPDREQKLLTLRSGNRCAFRECRRVLTADGSPPDRIAVLGEMAHIVAESPNGPRGDSPLPFSERNRYENLILLCNIHHQQIDDQPHTYTVERLHAIKEEHERWVEETLGRSGDGQVAASPPRKTDTLYSTLLSVEYMPPYVYGVPCVESEQAVQRRLRPVRLPAMAPFIRRGDFLYAFHDFREPENPFWDVAHGQPVERFQAKRWWDDPDKLRWYVDLLNRALNKLTGRRGLHLDREHKRYYFPAEKPGEAREVTYRPLNQRHAERQVVWQPKRKSTGEGRGYWYHRALGLRFLRVGKRSWCLSLRPAIRVTVDGVQTPRSDLIGRRVNRKMARMFNYDLLGEVQFWRDYLAESRPRIILPFGRRYQQVRISTNFMEGPVCWPGIPEQYARRFKNVAYSEDLFSWAELNDFAEDDGDEPWLDDEEDEADDDLD